MDTNNTDSLLPYVRLRAMEPEDLEMLYDLENDPSVWDVSATNVPYSRKVLIEYITSSRCDIYADGQVRLMVDNEEGETVGIVDLTSFDPQHRRAELGIVIKRAYRGKGFGKSILYEICQYARQVIHLHQIYAIVSCENTNCLSLLKMFGFQGDMCLKDWVLKDEEYGDAYFLQKIL